MAQANVVREPSMDEILASIRRIIESNDVAPTGLATAMAEPQGFVGQPANDDTEEVPLTIDGAFDEDAAEMAGEAAFERHVAETIMPAQVESTVERNAPSAPKSLSLADVAARVRAASERNSAMLRETQPQRAEPSFEAVAVREEQSHQPVHTPMTDRASSEPVAEVAAEDVEKFEATEARPLISNAASEQVSRSFQSLALAVDDANRRSFDDIAADLLRPMLQEWLDDNLPTLVERLVREEIERVARGPRR